MLILVEHSVSRTQVGVGRGQQSWLGSELHRRFVLSNRFGQLVMGLKIGAQIAVAHRILWIDARGRREMRLRRILFAFEDQCSTEIVFGDKIILSYCQGVGPQGEITLPEVNLAMRHRSQRGQYDSGGNSGPEAELRMFRQFSGAESNHHEDAD